MPSTLGSPYHHPPSISLPPPPTQHPRNRPPPPPPDFFLHFHNNFNNNSWFTSTQPTESPTRIFCIITITSILGSPPHPPPDHRPDPLPDRPPTGPRLFFFAISQKTSITLGSHPPNRHSPPPPPRDFSLHFHNNLNNSWFTSTHLTDPRTPSYLKKSFLFILLFFYFIFL